MPNCYNYELWDKLFPILYSNFKACQFLFIQFQLLTPNISLSTQNKSKILNKAIKEVLIKSYGNKVIAL